MPAFLLLFFLAKKVTKKPSLVQCVFRLQGFISFKKQPGGTVQPHGYRLIFSAGSLLFWLLYYLGKLVFAMAEKRHFASGCTYTADKTAF